MFLLCWISGNYQAIFHDPTVTVFKAREDETSILHLNYATI